MRRKGHGKIRYFVEGPPTSKRGNKRAKFLIKKESERDREEKNTTTRETQRRSFFIFLDTRIKTEKPRMKKHIFQPCYAGIFLPGGKKLSLKRVFFLANFENKTSFIQSWQSCFIQYTTTGEGIAPEIIERHLRQS